MGKGMSTDLRQSWDNAQRKFGGFEGNPSARQLRLLRAIADWIDRCGYPPSIRDLTGVTDMTSTSVVDYNLHGLARMGLLTRVPEISRSIVITEEGQRLL